MSFRPRTAVNATAIALVGLLGLSACNSQPGHRRVVQDMIDSLALPADEDECMRDVLAGYSNDELDQIAEQNQDLDFATEGATAAGTEQYQEYVANLSACVGGAATESTDAGTTGTTEPGDAPETTEPGDAPETTEPGDAPETTEPGDAPEAIETSESSGTTET